MDRRPRADCLERNRGHRRPASFGSIPSDHRARPRAVAISTSRPMERLVTITTRRPYHHGHGIGRRAVGPDARGSGPSPLQEGRRRMCGPVHDRPGPEPGPIIRKFGLVSSVATARALGASLRPNIPGRSRRTGPSRLLKVNILTSLSTPRPRRPPASSADHRPGGHASGPRRERAGRPRTWAPTFPCAWPDSLVAAEIPTSPVTTALPAPARANLIDPAGTYSGARPARRRQRGPGHPHSRDRRDLDSQRRRGPSRHLQRGRERGAPTTDPAGTY